MDILEVVLDDALQRSELPRNYYECVEMILNAREFGVPHSNRGGDDCDSPTAGTIWCSSLQKGVGGALKALPPVASDPASRDISMASLSNKDVIGNSDLEAADHVTIEFVHWDVVPTRRRSTYKGRLLKVDASGRINYAMPNPIDYTEAIASGRMKICIECIGVSMVRTKTLALMSVVPPAVMWLKGFLESATTEDPGVALDALQQVDDPCIVCGPRLPTRKRCPLCSCASHPACLELDAPTPAQAAAATAAMAVKVGPMFRPGAEVPIWCELIGDGIDSCCSWCHAAYNS